VNSSSKLIFLSEKLNREAGVNPARSRHCKWGVYCHIHWGNLGRRQ